MVVDIKEVFNVKTKSFKQAEMKDFLNKRKGAWLGFMRIRCSKYLCPFPIMLVQEKLALGRPAFISGSPATGGFEIGVRQMAQGATKYFAI